MVQRDTTHVLVIDDDEEDFLVLRDLLNEIPNKKFQIEWAPTYEEGKASLALGGHDICFLDYRLGPQTGLDLLKEAAARGYKMPVILLTGYGEHHVDLEAMKVGAADYLVKDQIMPSVLERSIRYSIHRNQMEAQILMQDRLASIGLLASSLAHEIGTPLGVIRGRAEYLGIQTQDSPQIKKNVDIIISQIDRVSHLIRSLLNLARGDTLKSSQQVNLTEIVGEVQDLMAHELRKNGIAIQNQLPSQLPLKVKAEAQPLHQVLLNLFVNSVHAIQSAKASGRTEGHAITISSELSNGFLTLSIEDTGCGISKKNMTQLFKPFFTTKEIGLGTGLGLATSYRIVESWGGKIEVESQEGIGTLFKIKFPEGSKA